VTQAAEAIWHDVECGGYQDDLRLWEELADSSAGPVLDLGTGTGRVALHLARRGHEVDAVDNDPVLVEELRRRAAAEGARVTGAIADVRELEPARAYGLVLAPTQLMQLLGGPSGRVAALAGIRRALAPGGVAALAIVEGRVEIGDEAPDIVPDVRELDGWIFSSLPLGVVAENGVLQVLRLRQAVSPEGELSEHRHTDVLEMVDAETVAAEAEAAGLVPEGTRRVATSERYVGSVALLVRRSD